MQRGMSQQPNQRAFELADVAVDVVRDEIDDRRVKLDAVILSFPLQDGDPRFELGLLDVRRKSPLESRVQAFFDGLDLAPGPLARHHHLLPPLMEGAEQNEKLFRRLLLPPK